MGRYLQIMGKFLGTSFQTHFGLSSYLIAFWCTGGVFNKSQVLSISYLFDGYLIERVKLLKFRENLHIRIKCRFRNKNS